MTVSESNVFFTEGFGGQVKHEHSPTEGTSYSAQVTKVAKYVQLNLQDQMRSFSEEEAGVRFLMSGQKLSNRDVLGFSGYLEHKYGKKTIRPIYDALLSDLNEIDGIDPFFAVTGCAPPSDIDKGWFLVKSNLDLIEEVPSREEIKEDSKSLEKPKKRFKERYLLYPFVFPGRGIGSFAHIVLIIIDQKLFKIYYYDPQGLTSNDPSRHRLFSDHPYFDLHENLVELSKSLFNLQRKEVIENVAPHQSDPVSCGVFVCRAMERLYQGMSVEKALSFDPKKESIVEIRKKIGVAYMQAMQQRYGGSER